MQQNNMQSSEPIDHLSGVKPIFILESDVLGKPKVDSGTENGYKNEFLVPT